MTPAAPHPHPHPLPTKGEGGAPDQSWATTVKTGLLPPTAWGRAGEGGRPVSQSSKGRT